MSIAELPPNAHAYDDDSGEPMPRAMKLRPDGKLRRAFIGSMYTTGMFLALAMVVVSGWQVIEWGNAFFFGTGTFSDGIKCFLAKVSMVCWARWVFLLYYVIQEHIDEVKLVIPEPEVWPFVSIFLPAYNEEEAIAMSIESMLQFDYPHYEVLVIDDGSKDKTYEVAKHYEGEYPFGRVKVFKKINGGKWSAHNFAYHNSQSDLVLGVDADSHIDADALRRSVQRLLADPKADALAGYTRVLNRQNLLLKLQTLEFVIWNGAMRQPQSRQGVVMCIPGPLGLFRRSALDRVYERFGKLPEPHKPGEYDGPFEGDTFAEDFDLTLAIQQTGGHVIYDRFSGCHTDCPDTMMILINQRYRWTRGSIQVIRKVLKRCRKDPSTRNWKMLGWLASSYIYDLLVYPFTLVAYMALIGMTLLGTGDMTVFVLFLIYSLGFRWLIGLPFIMDHREDPKLLLYMPFVDLYGTFILGAAFVISIIDEVFKKGMRW